MSSNVGADSNPSDCETSFVEEKAKNYPDVGKVADISNSGGESKQAKTQKMPVSSRIAVYPMIN